MRRFDFLVIMLFPFAAALGLAGCASSTTTTLKGVGGLQEVKVTRTTTGLIWGPCMPAPGSRTVAYVVDLRGNKSVYSPGEFSIFREITDGPRVKLAIEGGTIEIDRARHRLTVDLRIAGQPCELNGRYSYTD